ncbi:Rieske (2Fe-2S) protein [Nitrincola alkalisediminis]|uniref:Rieske (2Fe-2S) protein n=1 Tax=Nitrincola alkalisediminis TaxID=1366656 RepID=UPI00187714D0|nr:Rieske 2Fe-2S domain-containing protein [Nitrincola alkalisediminis]
MLNIGQLEDFPDNQAVNLDYDEQAFIVMRRKDAVYVYENHCPHRGIRLEWQTNQLMDIEKQFIQCATHGALFKPETGVCIAGPCRHQSLRACQTSIQDHQVYILIS